MKKSVFEQIVNLINDRPVIDIENVRAEINAEWDALVAKSQSKRNVYDIAKPIVFGVLTNSPMTVKEIYESCADTLPEGFTQAKISYALREYWADEVVKHDNGKSPNTYTAKV